MAVLTPIPVPSVSNGRLVSSKAALSPSQREPVFAGNKELAAADQLSFRQLRHLTKNALQRILCQVAQQDELRRTPVGRQLCEDIERQILFSATLADALFGMTREPGLLPVRFRELGEAVIGLFADPDQQLDLNVLVEGRCPTSLEEVVLRVAHEFLSNAVKHGMHARLIGHITVRVISGEHRTVLTVSDDGWGYGQEPKRGEGCEIAQLLAGEHGGAVWLRRWGAMTVATLDLPHVVRNGPNASTLSDVEARTRTCKTETELRPGRPK